MIFRMNRPLPATSRRLGQDRNYVILRMDKRAPYVILNIRTAAPTYSLARGGMLRQVRRGGEVCSYRNGELQLWGG